MKVPDGGNHFSASVDHTESLRVLMGLFMGKNLRGNISVAYAGMTA
jgi:hypothetical protein